MADLISNINKSRSVMKEIFSNEWDTSVIKDLSDEEVFKLYETKGSELDIGHAGALTITLQHKFVDEFKMHIVYYNFPQLNTPPTKTTKNFKDKIKRLYDDDIFSLGDNVVIIVNETISDTLFKALQSLNVSLELSDSPDGVFESFKKKHIKPDHIIHKRHFGKAFMFNLLELTNNLSKNRLVPKHKVIRSEEDIQKVLDSCNATKKQLPVILPNDIMARYNLVVQGDLVEITRSSKSSGNYNFYRFAR